MSNLSYAFGEIASCLQYDKIKSLMYAATAAVAATYLLFTTLSILLYTMDPSIRKILSTSKLCMGRVSHTRLKGGATHNLNYPVCFALLDLKQVVKVRTLLWPLFSVGYPRWSFSAFDRNNHMKDFPVSSTGPTTLFEQVRQFCLAKSNNQLDISQHSVKLLTNLSYFNYCFNPISVYYIEDPYTGGTALGHKQDSVAKDTCSGKLVAVIAEVSNTPWIEMHSYLLHEATPNTVVKRPDRHRLEAQWQKAFHVSPFMEMDYQYKFAFHAPSINCSSNILKVQSSMLKQHTKEVYFTASFEVQMREFSAWNLLYLLTFYPLYTRLVQVRRGTKGNRCAHYGLLYV
ncbi:DUF1365 family protein [archaeon]|nr:MAG: DUF1365 family protein [archaeon]